MKKKIKIPRQYSLVKLTEEAEKIWYNDDLKKCRHILFLGEIPNMGGHCVLVTEFGNIKIGYHTESFVELDEDTEV